MIPVQFHPDPTPPGGDPPFGHRPDAAHPAKHPAGNQPPNRLNILLSFAGWQPDPWVERLPRLLEPLGVASHVAGSGKHAQQVIRTVPIHIAVVDLALPLDDRCDDAPEFAEGGPRLLELLARLDSPPPVVAVKRARTTRDDCRDIACALRLGAFAVVDRPRGNEDLNLMLEVMRRCMARFYKDRWPA